MMKRPNWIHALSILPPPMSPCPKPRSSQQPFLLPPPPPRSSPADNIIAILNRHALGHMIDLVHAHQPRRELEHVIPQRDNDELGVLGAFLDVARHNRHLFHSQSPSALHVPPISVPNKPDRTESPPAQCPTTKRKRNEQAGREGRGQGNEGNAHSENPTRHRSHP